jgi:hypothetical protein
MLKGLIIIVDRAILPLQQAISLIKEAAHDLVRALQLSSSLIDPLINVLVPWTDSMTARQQMKITIKEITLLNDFIYYSLSSAFESSLVFGMYLRLQ